MNGSKIRVAVLRGGPSPAYEDSLRTGSHILKTLREMEGYEPMDVFIDREGRWHDGGLANDPHKILHRAEVVWNALHGAYGEDGEVQRLLERLQMPFTGSSTLASAFSTNKDLAKNLYQRNALLTPNFSVVNEGVSDDVLIEIFRTHLHPVVVKPATGVSGVGIRLARSFSELKDAVKKAFADSPKALVEEYVRGKVSTCTVIEKAKGEELYALIPSGTHPSAVNKQIEAMARRAHEILGQRHYSSSDFIITPKGRVYILETNSLPVFHEDTHHHQALLSTGWQAHDFADHCLKLALGRLA